MRFYFFLIFSRDSLLLSWFLNAIANMVEWPMISLIVKQYGQLLLPMKTSCLQFQSYINLYLLTLEMRLKRSSNVKHSVCIVYKMLFNAIEIELSIAHHFFFCVIFFVWLTFFLFQYCLLFVTYLTFGEFSLHSHISEKLTQKNDNTKWMEIDLTPWVQIAHSNESGIPMECGYDSFWFIINNNQR